MGPSRVETQSTIGNWPQTGRLARTATFAAWSAARQRAATGTANRSRRLADPPGAARPAVLLDSGRGDPHQEDDQRDREHERADEPPPHAAAHPYSIAVAAFEIRKTITGIASTRPTRIRRFMSPALQLHSHQRLPPYRTSWFLSDRSCILPRMPRPREFQPDDVLEKAMQEFWERGYRATSVDDLVRATGVRPGSLYGAFRGGKRALFTGSLARYSKLIVPRKLGELDGPDASIAEVRAYFDGLVQDLLSPEGRQGCLLVNSAIELAAEDDE